MTAIKEREEKPGFPTDQWLEQPIRKTVLCWIHLFLSLAVFPHRPRQVFLNLKVQNKTPISSKVSKTFPSSLWLHLLKTWHHSSLFSFWAFKHCCKKSAMSRQHLLVTQIWWQVFYTSTRGWPIFKGRYINDGWSRKKLIANSSVDVSVQVSHCLIVSLLGQPLIPATPTWRQGIGASFGNDLSVEINPWCGKNYPCHSVVRQNHWKSAGGNSPLHKIRHIPFRPCSEPAKMCVGFEFNYFGYKDAFTSNDLSFQPMVCSHFDTWVFLSCTCVLVKIPLETPFTHVQEIRILLAGS